MNQCLLVIKIKVKWTDFQFPKQEEMLNRV